MQNVGLCGCDGEQTDDGMAKRPKGREETCGLFRGRKAAITAQLKPQQYLSFTQLPDNIHLSHVVILKHGSVISF